MYKLAFILLLILTGIITGTFLTRTPIHLNQDELGFSLNAYSLTQSGYDENGRFLPLYFWHLNVMWATPIIVYLTALFLKFLPLSEQVIRYPSVLIGLLNIILFWYVLKKYFKNEKWAFLGVFLLITTPAHFIHSRILLDNLYIVPFVLGWLITLNRYPLLSVFILGLGIHSYHSAKVMMPLYFLITIVFKWKDLKTNLRGLAFLTISFLAPLLPLFFWLQKYPDTLIDQVKYTNIYDSNMPSWLGPLTLLSPKSILHRLDVYINFFNPNFLFFKGDQSLIHSTHKSGVFLVSLLIPLCMGIYQIWKKKDNINRIILVCFLTSPIAAVIAGDHYRMSRALTMLPLAIIIATLGFKKLLTSKIKYQFFVGATLIVLIPVQFSIFYYDYMKGYRIRSYNWFNNNIPQALESVLEFEENNPKNNIFLDKRVPFASHYWHFYTIKHNLESLQNKAKVVEIKSLNIDELPDNSLILFDYNNIDGQKETLGKFKKIKNITEPDGVSRFYIYAN